MFSDVETSTHDALVVGLSLTSIAHRVGDWPVDTFDASSLLKLVAILIQNNKTHSRVSHSQLTRIATNVSQDLLTHATSIIRSTLTRCKMSSIALTRILQITSALYRRADRVNGNVILNQVALVFADCLSELLVGRTKPLPSSLPAAIEVWNVNPMKTI